MTKNEKVTPIRKDAGEPEHATDREERMLEQGRSRGQSSEGRSEEHTEEPSPQEQGVTNHDVQEETARQSKVVPFREDATAGKRDRTGGQRKTK